MKFVRWLGAFGTSASLGEAAEWELSQTERQVAVEPLWHGRSLIPHVKIGMEIDEKASRFASGWMQDAWTFEEDGVLVSNRTRRGNLDRYRNMDRYLKAWSAKSPTCYGEAAFDEVMYRAVVVKKSATKRGMARASNLAASLNLPLRVIRS